MIKPLGVFRKHTKYFVHMVWNVRASLYLDGAPCGVGEKVERAGVRVVDIGAQQKVKLTHLDLLRHQEQLEKGG